MCMSIRRYDAYCKLRLDYTKREDIYILYKKKE